MTHFMTQKVTVFYECTGSNVRVLYRYLGTGTRSSTAALARAIRYYAPVLARYSCTRTVLATYGSTLGCSTGNA
jgi:hypothetical protein